jgi:hypothetical protein
MGISGTQNSRMNWRQIPQGDIGAFTLLFDVKDTNSHRFIIASSKLMIGLT